MTGFLKNIVRLKKFYVVLIIFLFILFLLSRGCIPHKSQISYGITFSKKQSQDLGLDWKKNYLAILDDLKIKKIRLASYWDEVEPRPGNFNWADTDWQINEASKRNVEIILAVGGKLPRWPECHFPDWANQLTNEARKKAILNYIEKSVNRYKEQTQIIAWQVENEPFLIHFGECPEFRKEFLDQEIALVKNIDLRPVIITDSGELSLWIPAAKRADIFGTTMYRDTYSQLLKSYIHYPIEPGFFRFKKNISQLFAQPQKWIVIELQAEPWGPEPFQNLTRPERDKTMNLAKFRDILEFSRKTGFSDFYLWGAEWWYWEKEIQNNPEIWKEAKKLWQN